ncbi:MULTISPECIES: hypothetical protein [unclassified Microcoleus]|uniref:hypothetical protein n=1 Tax=unclassified Microcoleus TaxID=2642155 RepID=UPI002FD64A21
MSKEELASECVWQFKIFEENPDISDVIVENFSRVCLNGFGIERDWTTNIKKKLSNSTMLGMLQNQEGRFYGFATYLASNSLLGGSYLLWEDGICLTKEAQGKGFSRTAIEQAVKIFPKQTFGWIGGRTQNPLILKRYKRLGKTFPFDELYETQTMKSVMDFLIENIPEVKKVYTEKKLNRSNGICTAVYKEGRFGDYPVGIEGTEEFEKQLEQWGFQRARGDAVIIVARWRQNRSESEV